MSHRITRIAFAVTLPAALALTVSIVHKPVRAAGALDTPGTVPLKSAGVLAFGPDGVLFVADSMGGAILAIDTNDRTPSRDATKIDVQGIDARIAELVGGASDQILINGIAANPISKNVYISASRGRGPDATPIVLRVDGSGKLTPLALDKLKSQMVTLVDAPAAAPNAPRDPRTLTITDMAYVNGNVLVAGMSNEEWSSALRSIPYPFKTAAKGSQIQIWHASHGRYETEAPIRSFVPYTIDGQPYILASYTCTPLVKIPLSALQPGARVKGVTITDLGSGNQPYDMVPYKKDGHEYILIANSSFGVVKLHADKLGSYKPIDSPTVVDAAGAPYDRIATLKNVQHIAALDDTSALILTGKPFTLQSIALP
jgi:hypothetical protein